MNAADRENIIIYKRFKLIVSSDIVLSEGVLTALTGGHSQEKKIMFILHLETHA